MDVKLGTLTFVPRISILINLYITHSSTYLMPCIFGFGFHASFCPCDLLMTDESHLLDVVCPNCKRRLRCQYNAVLNDKEVNVVWEDFNDFVYSRVNEQLHEICASYPQSCAYGLTDTESKTVGDKFEKVCDQFMTYG